MTLHKKKSIPFSMLEARDIVTTLLQQGETVSTVVHGNSMQPTIRSGESVTIAPLPPDFPRPGNIVLFQYARRLVLHRLIAFNPKTGVCLLAGDMNHSGTECIPVTNCIGIAISLLRQGTKRDLGTRTARWMGLGRYRLRPLRRLLDRIWHRLR